MRTIRLGAAVAVMAATIGCGVSQAEAEAEAQAKASVAAERRERAAERKEARARRERRQERRQALQECMDETESLLETLQQIDSRLDIGLNVGELGDYLGDASVAYDQIDFDSMSDACTLKVGIALEDGLNQYIDSLNKWERCVEDYSCEVEGAVLRRIRKHWSEASERIEYVEKKFSSPARFAKGPDSLGG